MRPLACPGLLLLVVVLGVGCDSDQPLEVGTRTVDVTFDAPSARVNAFNVWDLTEVGCPGAEDPCDVNDDGEPDVSLWCEALSGMAVKPSLRRFPGHIPSW